MIHKVTKSYNEWYNEWQQMTTSDNDWQQVAQCVTTIGLNCDNEWQGVLQWLTKSSTTIKNDGNRITRSDSEWQRLTTSGYFGCISLFFEPKSNLSQGTLNMPLFQINKEFSSPICSNFFNKGLFSEKQDYSEQPFLLSNYFDTTVTFSEHLFLQSSYSFWAATLSEQSLLRSSYFSRIAIFSEQRSTKKLLLETRKSFRAVSFSEQLLFWWRN